MLYLFIFFIVVGVTDFCTNNGIQIFIFIDLIAKAFIILAFISCIAFKVDGDFEFLILSMLIFLNNYMRGKNFYNRLEEHLKESEK
ncbi:MAG: hypothetical protein ABF289_05785 [Clostridiales bacterium]